VKIMGIKGIRETITFSCEPDFKQLISTKVKELGYQNKSQMIRDALQSFFESETIINKVSDEVDITLVISVVYDHHDSSTLEEFICIQHKSNVAYSSHFHMPGRECLEIMVVNDKAKNARDFIKELRAITGLKYISIKAISRAQIAS
jgi:metal-responsive CopG/Arc/MetJ family transcriptional regulator